MTPKIVRIRHNIRLDTCTLFINCVEHQKSNIVVIDPYAWPVAPDSEIQRLSQE